MHELWITKQIMEIVHQHLAGKDYSRIKKIVLEIGELAGIDTPSLMTSFTVITNKTKAQGAVLEIIAVPGMAICDTCKKNVSINRYASACQHCNSFSLTITQGEELSVKSMEIE